MNIRPANEFDIPALLQMISRHDESVYKGRLKEMQHSESVQLVAEEDGVIIGQAFLAYYGRATFPHYPDIRDLHVVEDSRGKGIGSELIHVCEQLSIQKGFNRIGLAVNPQLNVKARLLYQRLGYQKTEGKPYLDGVFDGHEEWVIDMTKKLMISYDN